VFELEDSCTKGNGYDNPISQKHEPYPQGKIVEDSQKYEKTLFYLSEPQSDKENDFCSANFMSEKNRHKQHKGVGLKPSGLNQGKPEKNIQKGPMGGGGHGGGDMGSCVKFLKRYNEPKSFENVVIPANLKMKDEHLPYFCDLQNVLILFSEMKSRIEILAKEKAQTQQKNEILQTTTSKLQQDLKNFESEKSILVQTLKATHDEKNRVYKELMICKDNQESFEVLGKKYENQKLEIAELSAAAHHYQIDNNVLKALMKEMIVHDQIPINVNKTILKTQ
jgi:hypothetical protein